MEKSSRATLVAMAIGDGYVRPRRKEKSQSSELQLKHCARQLGYLEWKAEEVKKILGGTCNIRSGLTTLSNGKTYQHYRFIKAHKYFNQIRNWLYTDGKKRITQQVLDMIDAKGMAIWYMDDASQRCNRNRNGKVTSLFTEMATQTDEEQAHLIADHYDRIYDLQVKVYPNKGSFNLRANTENSKKWSILVAPFLVPCMRYKIRYFESLIGHECSASQQFEMKI